MSTVLAYTSPAAGHVFPLVPGLLALQERGHSVHLRTDPSLVHVLRDAGLHVQPIDPRIAAIRVDDHEARGSVARLRKGFERLLDRGRLERDDVRHAIGALEPDVVLVDSIAYGAAVAAEEWARRDAADVWTRRQWATTLPSLLPLPEPGIPPYGLGLRPRGGPLGHARDAAGWHLVERLYARAMLPKLNALRTDAGLSVLASPIDNLLAADRLLVLTGAPLEYPRSATPPNVRFVGAQLWDPPAEPPDWLLEDGDPWVLVTCSTEYQGDEALAAAAIEALRDEPVRVIVTLADADGARLPQAANARCERFVPHGPVLERAAAVICHAGMGITQKAIAAGVPIVAVPFGRDQPEVARRIVACGAGVAVSPRRLSPARLRAAVRAATGMHRGAAAASAVRPRGAVPAVAGMREQVEASSARLEQGGERFADGVEELLAPAAVAVP